MTITEKIVNFDQYCNKCKYRNFEEEENPCYECLQYGANVHTDQPVNFKEGKAIIRKEKK